jgi:hypothetical protein
MTTPRDPDEILAGWLEEGPTRLPDPTRRAISVATRTTDQKRRSLWAPWRNPLMTSVARFAVAAIAVIAVIGGAVYFTGPGQSAGGTPASPSPSPSTAPASAPPSPAAQGTVPPDWTTYVSSRFAYSMDYPTDWVVVSATRDWPVGTAFPFPDGPAMDTFAPTPTSTRVFVSSVEMQPNEVEADWLTKLDAINTACRLSGQTEHVVDGEAARQQDFFCFGTDYGIEVALSLGGRFYLIDLFSQTPIGETDRATFERFLESFQTRVGG